MSRRRLFRLDREVVALPFLPAAVELHHWEDAEHLLFVKVAGGKDNWAVVNWRYQATRECVKAAWESDPVCVHTP